MDSSDVADAFAALSIETRLNAIRLLMAAGPNGMPAGALATRLGLPASTASFHLAALERAGLTQTRRQGRQIIHAARIARVRQMLVFLTETCCAGRPELCGDIARLLPASPEETEDGMTAAFNVLFLCRHNSARSIMAEAILARVGAGGFHAWSAGSEPIAAPNPDVLAKLRAFGHPTEGLRSKSWHEFTGPNAPRMDFVITLCDTVEDAACPDFGELTVTGAWPLPDPAKFTGSALELAALLNEIYAALERRLRIFIALPFATLDRMALRRRLDEIGGGMHPIAAGGH
ncbi:MAG: metalloregulator ArsR/SmtB family transcription factor [Rhodospirillales bacterium]|nr:metalloregulator ArsR/SmtB family transcription factor [Rhodospirillales bacterium]